MEYDIDFDIDESLLKQTLSFDSPAENVRSDSAHDMDMLPPFPNSSLLMDSCKEVTPLEDEIFDFDISMSPDSSLIKTTDEENTKVGEARDFSQKATPGTPLSENQIIELFNEAQNITLSLQKAAAAEKDEKLRNKKIPFCTNNGKENKSNLSLKQSIVTGTMNHLKQNVNQEKSLFLKIEELNLTKQKAAKVNVPRERKGESCTSDAKYPIQAVNESLSVSDDTCDSVANQEKDIHEQKNLEHNTSKGMSLIEQPNSNTDNKGTAEPTICEVKSLKRPANFSPAPDAKRHASMGIRQASGLRPTRFGVGSCKSGELKKPTLIAGLKPAFKGAEKSALRAPSLKPSLLQKPATSMTAERRKPIKAVSALKAPGPLKAMNTVVMDTCSKPAPESQDIPSSPVTKKGLIRPVRISAATHNTPVKQERNVQPKRLLEPDQCKTPERKNSGGKICVTTPVSQSAKRRSFLPTPNKLGSSVCSSSSSHAAMSTTSSMDSALASPALRSRMSPALRGRSPKTTPVLALMDINGINEKSPSCLKPRKQRVQRTPLNQEGEMREPKRSLWSPIKKNKLAIEDQIYQCTKRTARQ